jgi:hypothetical protein
MPSFYHRPETIADIVDQTVGKVLDQFDIPHNLFRRWEGTSIRRQEREAERLAGDAAGTPAENRTDSDVD